MLAGSNSRFQRPFAVPGVSSLACHPQGERNPSSSLPKLANDPLFSMKPGGAVQMTKIEKASAAQTPQPPATDIDVLLQLAADELLSRPPSESSGKFHQEDYRTSASPIFYTHERRCLCHQDGIRQFNGHGTSKLRSSEPTEPSWIPLHAHETS